MQNEVRANKQNDIKMLIKDLIFLCEGLLENEEESEEVALMRKSGAIPICLTSACDQGPILETRWP